MTLKISKLYAQIITSTRTLKLNYLNNKSTYLYIFPHRLTMNNDICHIIKLFKYNLDFYTIAMIKPQQRKCLILYVQLTTINERMNLFLKNIYKIHSLPLLFSENTRPLSGQAHWWCGQRCRSERLSKQWEAAGGNITAWYNGIVLRMTVDTTTGEVSC